MSTQANLISGETTSPTDKLTSTNHRDEELMTQTFYIPNPYYSLQDENLVQKQNSNDKDSSSDNQKNRLTSRSSTLQNTPKQAPISSLLQSCKLFDSIQVKNFPSSIHKNKLYVVGQMNPIFYKNEKNQIKITDPLTLQLLAKYKIQHDQPQRVNNMLELPVYLIEEKRWTIEKLRIKYFSTLSSNWSFLHPSRISDKSRERTENQNGNGNSITSTKKASQKQKPMLYFPNELTNQAYCKDSQFPQVIYLFGGVYQERMSYSSKIWKIDFEEKSIQMIEQRTDGPDAREGASLCFYSSQWLILYGGYNLMNCQVFNQFYAYSVDNKSWYMIDTDYDSYFTPRINFSFSYNPSSKSCYLFGGMVYDHNNHECLLDDMYQFRVVELDYTEKRPSFHRKIKSSIETRSLLPKQGSKWPYKAQGHKTFWIDKNIMVMIGGEYAKENMDIQTSCQNSLEPYEAQNDHTDRQSLNKNVWIFDRRTENWVEVLPFHYNGNWKGSLGFSIDFRIRNPTEYELIVFGGYSNIGSNKINKLSLFMKDYSDAIRKSQLERQSFINCLTCTVNKLNSKKIQQLQVFAPTFLAYIIDQYIFNSLPFAFTAFGQLTSLAVEKQSSRIVFSYTSTYHPKQDAYFKIEQDGQLPYTAEEIAQKIHQFSIHDSMEIFGVSDKKYKMYHNRLHTISQFCNRLKIAGLRLGEEIFFIAANTNNQILVFLLRVEQNSNSLCQKYSKVYKSYFYAVNETTLELLPEYSEQIQKEVVKHYDKTIQKFYKEKKNVKTFMKISKLRKVWCGQPAQQRYELTPDFKRNTILINFETLPERKSTFYKESSMEESIDINLKAYLSIYFITRQIKILLKIDTLGTNTNAGVVKLPSSEQLNSGKATNQSNEAPKYRSNLVLRVQDYIGSQPKSTSLLNQGVNQANSQKKQSQKWDRRDKVFFPQSPELPTLNKLEEVNFQFMLPKIDQKLQTGELIEVESDVFGQFDCKIVEVYYWLGIKGQQQKKIGKNMTEKKSSVEKEDFPYSNGLLIYHKGQLVKRYKFDLGTLLLRQKFSSSNSAITSIPTENINQFHQSLTQFNTRLFGIIQVSDKYQTNIFGTDFLNEEFLENLYQRIQHVSLLYEKMYGTWNGVKLLKRPSDQLKRNEKVESSEGVQNKAGRKKVKQNEVRSNKSDY